eukprot:UN02770
MNSIQFKGKFSETDEIIDQKDLLHFAENKLMVRVEKNSHILVEYELEQFDLSMEGVDEWVKI